MIRLKYPRRPIRPVCSCNRIDDVAWRKPDQYSNVFFVGVSIKRLVGRLVISFAHEGFQPPDDKEASIQDPKRYLDWSDRD